MSVSVADKKKRLFDPSRRVPSTHDASSTRTAVYNTLGLNKPGFWADWRKRGRKYPFEQEDDATPPDQATGPSEEVHKPITFNGDPDEQPKKDFTPLDVQVTKPPPPPGRQWEDWFSKPMGKAMQGWVDQWDKRWPTVTNNTMVDLMRVTDTVFYEKVAEATRGGENIMAAMKRISAALSEAERKVRANKQFGSLGETTFDKMYRLLHYRPKANQTPPYVPPTFKSTTSGGKTTVEQDQISTKWGLNVSGNGYQSSAEQQKPPMVMARQALTAKTTMAKNPLQGIGIKKATGPGVGFTATKKTALGYQVR